MANFLSNLFGSKTQSVLGIDIGTSSIKVVQLKKSGTRAVLETYGELSLGPYAGFSPGQATNLSLEKVAEALKDLLSEKEVNVTTNVCGMSISFASSLMSVLQMPNVSLKDLANMVPLEARKYIPVPISEVTLDWSVIPKNEIKDESNPEDVSMPKIEKNKTGMLDILVVAIHNDTLARYAQIASQNNLRPSFFEIEIFSIMRSVLDEYLQPVFIFDFGSASTKFFIVERGILLSSHTVNMGSQNITASISKSFGIPLEQAEILKRKNGLLKEEGQAMDVETVVMLTLQYLFEEAKRAMISYEKKYNKNIGKILMVGGGSSLKGIKEKASEFFQTDVEQGNPFSKVVTPAFLENVLRETGPQFAVAVGLALRKLQELD
jgi:type IV pilus assembly protein PilM